MRQSIRIPLIGSLTSRDKTNTALYGTSQKDQFFQDAAFQITENRVSGKSGVLVSARQSYASSLIPSGATGGGTAIRFWRSNGGAVITAFGNTNSTIYSASDSLGTITGQAKFIDEGFISVPALVIVSTDHTGWFYASDAGTGSPTFTGDLTNASANITNVADTDGIYVGQALTHANIPAGTRVSVVSGTTVTMTANATGTSAGTTITRTPIAKVIDTDFPGNASRFLAGRPVHLDGYQFQMDVTGRVYNSVLNNPASYTPGDYFECSDYEDGGISAWRYRNYILGFCGTHIEFLRNAGHKSGSPLARVQGMTINVGALSQYAICDYMDTVAWIGRQSGIFGIYIMEGGQARKISDHAIDVMLNNTDLSNARLHTLSNWAYPVIALALSASAANLYVYHHNVGMWHPWVLTQQITQSDTQINPDEFGTFYVGGTIARYVAPEQSPASATVQIGPTDIGTKNRKKWHKFRIIGDKANATSNVSVSWSDDDGQTFSSARTVDMSSSDPKLDRCGLSRNRIWKMSGISEADTDRVQRIEAVEIDYEVCSI